MPNTRLRLPDKFIRRSASLKHLTLQGYGMDWGLSPAFEGLKSLNVFNIPTKFQPSMIQLLSFLSRLPLLQTLSVIDIQHGGSSSHNFEQIHMKYLSHLQLSCASLPIIESIFDYLTFSGDNITTVSLRFTIHWNEPFTATLRRLTQTLDNATSGLVLQLTLGDKSRIRCWKSGGQQQGPSSMIELDYLWSTAAGPGTQESPTGIILQSLRLNRLEYLAVKESLDIATWTLFGNLPGLQELVVYENENAVIKVLSPTTGARTRTYKGRSKPKTKASSPPAFPALINLTIEGWEMNKAIVAKLLGCVKLRGKAQLPLKSLGIESCRLVKASDLEELRRIIDEVKWDGSGYAKVEREENYSDRDDYDSYNDTQVPTFGIDDLKQNTSAELKKSIILLPDILTASMDNMDNYCAARDYFRKMQETRDGENEEEE
ncbi:hypothetical protein H0H92_009358 [Tricholoma furcatifolium]|nr:hypothetical protein H0H92_009358 [Tricholoma furcatifolium]